MMLDGMLNGMMACDNAYRHAHVVGVHGGFTVAFTVVSWWLACRVLLYISYDSWCFLNPLVLGALQILW
jgi:hypothetical protein